MKARCIAAREQYGLTPNIGVIEQVFDMDAAFARICAEVTKLPPLALVVVAHPASLLQRR